MNHFTAVGLAGGAADLPGSAVVGFLAIPPPALLVSFYNDLVSSVAPPHVKTLHTTSAPGGAVQLTPGCNEVVADLHNSVADLNRRPTDWRLIRTAESTFFVASIFPCNLGHAMFAAP